MGLLNKTAWKIIIINMNCIRIPQTRTNLKTKLSANQFNLWINIKLQYMKKIILNIFIRETGRRSIFHFNFDNMPIRSTFAQSRLHIFLTSLVVMG